MYCDLDDCDFPLRLTGDHSSQQRPSYNIRDGQKRRESRKHRDRSLDYRPRDASTSATVPSTSKVKGEWRHKKDPSLTGSLANCLPIQRMLRGKSRGARKKDADVCKTSAGDATITRCSGDDTLRKSDRKHHKNSRSGGPQGDDIDQPTAVLSRDQYRKASNARTEWRHKKDPTLQSIYAPAQADVSKRLASSTRKSQQQQQQQTSRESDSNQNHGADVPADGAKHRPHVRIAPLALDVRDLSPIRAAFERCLYGNYRGLMKSSVRETTYTKRSAKSRHFYRHSDALASSAKRHSYKDCTTRIADKVQWPVQLQA